MAGAGRLVTRAPPLPPIIVWIVIAMMVVGGFDGRSLVGAGAGAGAGARARLTAEIVKRRREEEEGMSVRVVHRHADAVRVRVRRRRMAAASDMPTLTSRVVTLDEEFGQYFAVLEMGSPGVEAALIMDTGSQLLWLQCQPCLRCGVQASGYPVFNPIKSSTYTNITCSSEDPCPLNDSVGTECRDSICWYAVTYGDHSNSTGYLSKEKLTMLTTKSSSYSKTHVIFGCGIINTGVEAELNASGLLGLDRGEFSIITQLNISVFSHCLPNRVHNSQVSGSLTLGKRPTSSISLQYTPMLQNDNSIFTSQFYYINLTGVSINGKLLDIPRAAFEMTASGDGGTIIDSGTTLTSFVDEAYSIVYKAFQSAMNIDLTQIIIENSDLLCYQVPLQQRQAPTPPNVTLHFDGSVNLQLTNDHVLRLGATDSTYNYYCMAFNSAGSVASGNRNFIGNFQQQDFIVEYDIENSRIGFAPTICNNGNSIKYFKWFSLRKLLWVLSLCILLL